MATNNSSDYSPTQYNVQVGGASGTLSNVAPSATSGVPVISGGSSANPSFGTAVVAGGGTGVATMTTAYAPVCAGTTATGALQVASTGLSTSGYVLTSNGSSSLPSFQAAAGGVTGPGSSTTRDIATFNGTAGAALYDNPGVTISSSGIFQNTHQPAFSAFLNGSVSDATGNATVYTVAYDTVLFDQGSNFNGTTTFTAPVTGKYKFSVSVLVTGLAAANTLAQLVLVTTANPYGVLLNPVGITYVNLTTLTVNALVPMSATDTAYVTLQVNGGTKIVGVQGNTGTGGNFTWFSGHLVC